MNRLFALAVALTGVIMSGLAAADERCLGPVARQSPLQHAPLIVPAALRQIAAGQTSISFVGHATFLIESPGGVTMATDYNDYVRPAATPDIATMNRAHSTHFTPFPDPAIKHVLRGWADGGGPARHDIAIGDVTVRNVPTNIRDGGRTDYYGNSIFIFQMAGLCIAHLGHLHHTLSPDQLKEIGKVDVVLVPVDGSWTLNIDGMVGVLKQINAPLMIPMHFFGQSSLNRFLERAQAEFQIERSAQSSLIVTRETLPAAPKVFVLQPQN